MTDTRPLLKRRVFQADGRSDFKKVCVIPICAYVFRMRSILLTLHTVALAVTIPSLAFGMGQTPDGSEPQPGEPGNLRRQPPETVAATPQTAVVQGPYNLGQAIYNGTYKFKKSAGTHVAEKAHRLTTLQPALPAADRGKINPKTLSNQLSDREMNALEYYIQMKTGKYVDVAPSWAKTEPPVKVAKTK